MPTVAANGVDLYYERRGDGPPVVFLHGMGLDHRLWPEPTDPLADDYEVVVLDTRFHGRSGGDPTADVSVDTYADDLHAFVTELDLDAHAVVGHSMGAMVALRYVDRYPSDVEAVVTLGGETPDHPTLRARFYQRVVFPLHDRLRDRLGEAWANRFMYAVNWLARDDAGLSDLDEFERVVTDHHADYPEPTAAEHEAIEDALATYPDLDIAYDALTTPVLAMYGERELAVIEDYAEHVATSTPNGRAVEIPDAAHVSIVDNPGFVVDTIRDFLDEHLAPADSTAPAR